MFQSFQYGRRLCLEDDFYHGAAVAFIVLRDIVLT